MAGVCKVLAVASGGGHWVQLMQLLPSFAGHEVAFVTVQRDYAEQVRGARFFAVHDATRWDRWGLVILSLQLLWILLRVRPHVVVTTGAAPGVLALVLAKKLGATTVWIDSIANVEELSMSGRHAKRHADVWLTQWPHLAKPDGPQYRGGVL
jgi:UDP-N-acetylglucosamine:LPS N-acetylglucosamine transferase